MRSLASRARSSGVRISLASAFSIAIAVSLFGGTAEPLALWFKSIGREAWFSYYLTALIAISLLVYATMRDTRHRSALE